MRRWVGLVVGTALLAGCASPRLEPHAATPVTPAPGAAVARSAPVPLPPLPPEGVVLDVRGVATIRSLDGRTAVPLPGFRVRGGVVTGSRTWLVDADEGTWLLDLAARRLVRSAPAYRSSEGAALVRTLRRPERRGRWLFALPGPHGRWLAQWSGECEVPTVYVVDSRHRLRQVGPRGRHVNALARGWTAAGQPVVEFPEAACGEGLRGPGLYVETAPYRYRLVVASTGDVAYYSLRGPAVPPCARDAYRLAAVADGATGSTFLGAELHAASSAPCRVDDVVTLTLLDAGTGRLLDVPSNPLQVPVRGVLGVDDLHADAVWGEPYCPAGDVDLVASDGAGRTSTAHRVVRPRCDPAVGQSGRGPGLSTLRR